MLVAPVVDSSADTRAVYLPAGTWFRVGSDSVYGGGRRVTVSAPRPLGDGGDTTGLRGLPLFARAGAVIPMQAVLSHEDARHPDTLALHVWPGGTTPVASVLYEDAGDGYAYRRDAYRATTFTNSSGADDALDIALARTGTYAGARTFAVTVHAVSRPRSVQADGRSVPFTYSGDRRTATLVVPSGVRRITITP